MKLEELLKTLLENKPAKITAEYNENGKSTIAFKGRGIDITVLSISIIEEIIKESNGALTVDDYCEMLKYTINKMSKPKEQRDVENEKSKN